MTTIPAPSQRAGEKTVMVPLDQKLGKIFGIDYPALIPWLLASVQELKTLFEGDHDTLINLRAANDNLRKEFEAYKAAHP